MNDRVRSMLAGTLVVLALMSVGAAVWIWLFLAPDDAAHGERLAIFVGLWAPTFTGLAAHIRPVWRRADAVVSDHAPQTSPRPTVM